MASIFTQIINGEIPCHKVYEDDKVLAFLDINPASKGHMLVVTKEEIDHFDDLPEDLYAHVMSVVHKLTKRIKEVYNPMRVGLMVFGTEVPHAHVHLVPLYTGNEMYIERAEVAPSQSELAKIAKNLENTIK